MEVDAYTFAVPTGGAAMGCGGALLLILFLLLLWWLFVPPTSSCEVVRSVVEPGRPVVETVYGAAHDEGKCIPAQVCFARS
jgi:hypothetical protein